MNGYYSEVSNIIKKISDSNNIKLSEKSCEQQKEVIKAKNDYNNKVNKF